MTVINQTFAPKFLIQFRVSSFLAVSKLLKAKKETQDFKSIHDRPAVDEVASQRLDSKAVLRLMDTTTDHL